MLAAVKTIGAMLGLCTPSLTVQTNEGAIQIPSTVTHLEYKSPNETLTWKVQGKDIEHTVQGLRTAVLNPLELNTLTHLTNLNLDHTTFTSKKRESNVTLPQTLTYLSVSEVKVGNSFVLHLPPQLQACYADRTSVGIAAEENLPYLTRLKLGRPQAKQGYIDENELPNILRKAPNLTYLMLESYPLTSLPESILALSNLQQCELQRATIKEMVLKSYPSQISKQPHKLYSFSLKIEQDQKMAQFMFSDASAASAVCDEFVNLIQTTSPDIVTFFLNINAQDLARLVLKKEQQYQEGTWANLDMISEPKVLWDMAGYNDVKSTAEILIDFAEQIKRALNSRPLKSARHQAEDVLL